jgi:hypothetical protein
MVSSVDAASAIESTETEYDPTPALVKARGLLLALERCVDERGPSAT